MATQMLSVITSSYSDPKGYELSTLPAPVVSRPTDVVIKVHAASVNPIDVKKAAGALKVALSDEFPYKIGYDCSGIVTAIGDDVKELRVGDEVYTRLPERDRGAFSEYVKSSEQYIALKPKSLSFDQAASIPLAAMTALQALRKYKGSLAGKTVFVPAGLSGTGAYALQLAKNVFHAGKVITTVSTGKLDKIDQLLGQGVVDQVIDYTTTDPATAIPAKSVDFILDTTGQAMSFLSLMAPSTSLIISISTTPSGLQLQESALMQPSQSGAPPPRLPWYARAFLDLADAVRKLRAWRWHVEYSYLFLDANAADLRALTGFVEERRLLPVVGRTVRMEDIEDVRDACFSVYTGKGGLGKTVIQVGGHHHN